MRPARRVLAALVAAFVCLASFAALPRTARADERGARVHFDEAESLYALGDFEAALAEYQAAFAAEPLPAFLFNIAQCQRNLERYGDAAATFRRYLAQDPDAPNRPAVQKLIVELERKRDRQAALRPPPAPPPEAPPRQERVALVPVPPPTNARPAPRAASSPFYTKWWFITGVLVAGAAVTGVVIYDARQGDGGGAGPTGPGGPAVPTTDFGNTELPR